MRETVKILWTFIILNIASSVRGTDPNVVKEEEYYDPSADGHHLILWNGLFTKINKLLLETDKINQNLLDLNKRFDDLCTRQEIQESNIQKLIALSNVNAKTLNGSCQEYFKSQLSNNKNASLLECPPGSNALEETLNKSNPDETWTTILRRQDGSVNFKRNWTEYKNGFGNPPNGEFFIGLEKLHQMTTQGKPQELMVVLKDWKNETRTAQYSHFQIDGESKKYMLKALGKYGGDAGDSMAYHIDVEFASFDADNTTAKCATRWEGAWWFNNCYHSHLFGPYRKEKESLTKGVSWLAWKGHDYSLKFAEMKIRPQV